MRRSTLRSGQVRVHPAGSPGRFTGLTLLLVALAWRPASGQTVAAKPDPAPVGAVRAAAPPDSLLGRWEFVRIVDAEGRPDDDADGLAAFTFSAGGVLTVERTREAVRAEPDAPKRIRYRVEGRELVLAFGSDSDRATFRFEGDTLLIRDAATGDTATLRRPER